MRTYYRQKYVCMDKIYVQSVCRLTLLTVRLIYGKTPARAAAACADLPPSLDLAPGCAVRSAAGRPRPPQAAVYYLRTPKLSP